MIKKDTFSSFHPIINFLYFTLVIGFTMFLMHPIALAISLIASLTYSIYLDGKRAVLFALKYALPVMCMAAIINPAFNHEGLTILTYFPNGNPLTLESILYGISAATMLAAVLLWFRCYNAVMTSDKFVYLFGRMIPALSLILSMTLRFVPRFAAQLKTIKDSQYYIGHSTSDGSLFQRLRNAIKILSILITWSLENALETADSMKSRGYGLRKRTAFSIYHFDSRDKIVLTWLITSGSFLLCGIIARGLKWRYFANMKGISMNPITLCLFIIYACLCFTPVYINRREDRIWHSLKSKI